MAAPDFPPLVRLLGQHLGLTQEQFAHHLGASFGMVNVRENGRRAPLPFPQERMLEMANDAGMPVAELKIDSPRRGSER